MRGLKISWCRTVVVLFTALAMLQLLHMVLLTRLERRNLLAPRTHSVHVTDLECLQNLYESMCRAVSSNEVLDISGEYKIVRDITNVNNFHDKVLKNEQGVQQGVTLVTQCSFNHLHHIFGLVNNWKGPISVAVFASKHHVQTAMETIALLHQCFQSSSHKNISFSLILPMSDSSNTLAKKMNTKPIKCDKLDQQLTNHFINFYKNYDLGGVHYPNNLLRNVALSNSVTKYIMVTDVDMVPNPDLFSDFSRILHQQEISKISNVFDSKTAYVIPAFELHKEAVIPQDKSKLLEMWTKNEVRPFYHEMCWKCQRYTDYSAWKNLTITAELRIAYEVTWHDPWEPFYIADRKLPMYDERFRQYGFNRISQVCEMHIAGYKFAVLNNAFLLHKGFKTSETFHRTKEMEQEHNKLLFQQFKQELRTKYPDTSRRCY